MPPLGSYADGTDGTTAARSTERPRRKVRRAATAAFVVAVALAAAGVPVWSFGPGGPGSRPDASVVDAAAVDGPNLALGWSEDDEPAIAVWFEEGCDRSYEIGDYLHMHYRANVDGMARVWRYPDHELFTQEWMAAGITYEIAGPVTGPPGEWWVFGELLDTEATATCYYTTTLAATTATPEATSTGLPGSATPTETGVPTDTPSAADTATPTGTAAAMGSATPTETGVPTDKPSATVTATPTGSAVPGDTPSPVGTRTPQGTASPDGTVTPGPTSPSPPTAPTSGSTASATPEAVPGRRLWLPLTWPGGETG